MASDILIELKDVSIVRGKVEALCNVSWETRKGEHWFLMGNNGSGKTTLLEIVLGYLWPQEGEVSVFGEKFGRVYLPELRKKIGFISPWVFKRVRAAVPVYDVIASGEDASIGLFGRTSSLVDRRIRKESKIFGCDHFLRSRFGELSSGQQMKAALARAMVHRPEILVLDEPFAHLDIRSRAQLYHMLDDMAKRRDCPQIVLVTHHLEDVRPLFTHGLLLKEGRVALQGERTKVLNDKVLAKVLDVPIRFFRG